MTLLARKLDLVEDTHLEDGTDLLEQVAGQNELVGQAACDVEEEVEVLLVKRPNL